MVAIVILIVALLLLVLDRGKERLPGARSPYKAVAASLIQLGLGQIYNGEPRKAFLLWAGSLVLILLVTLSELFFHFWGMVAIILGSTALFITGVLDALRMARSLQTYTLKSFNRWYVYVGILVVSLLVSVPAERAMRMKVVHIPSPSMYPSLHVGDFIVAKLETPESYVNLRGDVLVFKYPRDNKTIYVKRVVGFPGEKIELRGGDLLVDGQTMVGPWTQTLDQIDHASVNDYGPYTVPEGTLFMLGDKLDSSSDSRIWGPLPRKNIVGVAKFINFSWDGKRKTIRLNRIGNDLTSPMVSSQ